MNLCLATSFKLFILVVFINLSVLAIIDFAYAVEPEEFLKDPKQELRARNISKNTTAWFYWDNCKLCCFETCLSRIVIVFEKSLITCFKEICRLKCW